MELQSCPGRARVRESGDPGPHGKVRYNVALREVVRWVPGLHPLGQAASLPSPGTRGLGSIIAHKELEAMRPSP